LYGRETVGTAAPLIFLLTMML